MSQSSPFGESLRRYRVAAGLSQEALAEGARLSTRAISDLERGARQVPRKDTVALLAEALSLPSRERAALEAAVARRRGARPTAPSPVTVQTSGPTVGLAALPAPPTPLVGRAAEMERAVRLLRRAEVRLLTLSGPGGVGKTRLALEIARQEWDSAAFAGSVAFVSLGATRDASLVDSTIAQALGLQESGTQSWAGHLLVYLRPRKILLVLDNFEQVADAAGLVADLLASCPQLKIVVSSRAPLHLRGEHVLSVPPLSFPQQTHPTSILEELAHSAAVDLFLQRARAASPDFSLTEANADAVLEICRRLDGLPLALELAAARIKVLPPRAMVARLATRLALLTGGPRDLPERQQTMRDTITWSYNLLTSAEQMTFRRLAVFSGGCTLEAAEAVTRDGGGDVTALEVLESLIDKNLVHIQEPAGVESGEPRLTMLETIREYANERLASSKEEAHLRGRHAAYFLELAEQVEPELRGARQEHWLASLEQEHDNLRLALDWARQSGDSDDGLRLAGTLWRFWYLRGYLSEGRAWLEAFLNGARPRAPARARAARGAAILAESQGDYACAEARATESLELYREQRDAAGMAGALNALGNTAKKLGDLGRAARLYAEGLTLWRSLTDTAGMASALNNLGVVARLQGDNTRASELSAESLMLRRQLGDVGGMATSLHNLGSVARTQGDLQRAIDLYEEALGLWQRGSGYWGTATVLTDLGHIARTQGNMARATTLYTQALILFRDAGDRSGMTTCLDGLASVACTNGQLEHGVLLFAAAMHGRMHASFTAGDRLAYDAAIAAAHNMLGEETFASIWVAGCALPLDQAVAAALVSGT